ncbi:hypothetical protein CPB86DRAFT_784963 [Serendipita vermifera]|nr:hypothetical protein CPB86DRAFT_784963 [Serendipita vermifera]
MSAKRPKRSHLLEHHKPGRVSRVPLVVPFKDSSRECLKRLARYEPPKVPPYPKTQSAAVLVALFVGRWGDIYVLLSRRSATLSSYAGDTALPGGKVDPDDQTLEDTARREAFEEIGLPRDKRRVPLLCTLYPFLARSNVIVTPVVVLVTDPTLRPILNTPEVDTLFSHPLASFLHNTAPFPLPSTSPYLPDTKVNEASNDVMRPTSSQEEEEVEEEDTKYVGPPPPRVDLSEYHTFHDMPWGPTRVRIHSFLTGRESSGMKPIAGLTASILLEVAQIGYGVAPNGFEVDAPGQAGRKERIAWEMNRTKKFMDAVKREGIHWDWEREERKEREKRMSTHRLKVTTRL